MTTHKGWLCEIDGVPIGFTIGNGSTGEMEVIAVLRAYEGRGIGRKLLTLLQDWLWSQGSQTLWLYTSPKPTRAAKLYTKFGWKDSGQRYPSGDMRLELIKPL